MKDIKTPSMILIMDGFGMNDDDYGNAIAEAKTPGLDELFEKYPMTRISACGEAVGLPEGQMGNSEVGHMNMGAGRIVYQSLSRISMAISDGSFFDNDAFRNAVEHVKANSSTLHISGLLSDGGVHSHIDHINALIELATRKNVHNVAVHMFLDGRDVPPRCAGKYISEITTLAESVSNDPSNDTTVTLATISGRYYAMDRDNRWERIEKAYNAMTGPWDKSNHDTTDDLSMGAHALANDIYISPTPEDALNAAYKRGEDDEFVKPTVISDDASQAISTRVHPGDSVIMANFRPDRAREITRCFVDPEFDGFSRDMLSDLVYVCMTEYDATMPNVLVAYPPEKIENTLGEYISKLGLNQLRIAETEKYAHVTFFFNGGVEEPNKNEDRILVPSPKVATYDLQPEMSAYIVTEKVLEAIKEEKYDLIILNFANADMVGHTGVMSAAIKAIETLDKCVPRICDAILSKGGQVLLTADHGNADVMLDKKGKPVTSHSLNKVPLVHIAEKPERLHSGGKLADIAPTMLSLMGIPVPCEMTGSVLTE